MSPNPSIERTQGKVQEGMRSGMSMDVLRRPAYSLHIWRGRLESCCPASVFPSGRGNLRTVIVL